jgi:uncharacterized Zn finger protein
MSDLDQDTCPLCGSQDVVVRERDWGMGDLTYYVFCDACGSVLLDNDDTTTEDAIDSWVAHNRTNKNGAD